MAITTNAICNSFKKQLMGGEHDFDASSDTYKLAMYTSVATLGASTTNYAFNKRSIIFRLYCRWWNTY
jgi:hypothetical protein